jgi:Na+/phosphate symporter
MYQEDIREWGIRLTKEALADREAKKEAKRTEWIKRNLGNLGDRQVELVNRSHS